MYLSFVCWFVIEQMYYEMLGIKPDSILPQIPIERIGSWQVRVCFACFFLSVYGATLSSR